MNSQVTPTASQVPDPDRRQSPRRLEDRRLLQRDRELEAARRMTQVLFEHLHPDELVVKTLTTAMEVVGGRERFPSPRQSGFPGTCVSTILRTPPGSNWIDDSLGQGDCWRRLSIRRADGHR